MAKKISFVTVTSILLVSLGLLSILFNFVSGWTFNFSWPLVVIMLGLAFAILGNLLLKEWPWADLLYIPACFLVMIGTVFLINLLTADWNAWAYAWMLLITGLALGVVFANRRGHWPRLVSRIGVGAIILSLTFASLFGALVSGRFFMVMAPILLVTGGLALAWLRPEIPLPAFLHKPSTQAASVPLAPAAQPAAPNQAALVEPLSARELEVLGLIDQGLTNPEIAAKLSLAPSTVKTHINNIYGKLAVQTRVQALKRARELRLLHISEQ
jgi:DNA-binding CsgD family transcriptional regulator